MQQVTFLNTYVNYKNTHFCFTVTFYGINFMALNFRHRSSNISEQHVLGFINVDSFSAEIHTDLSKCPVLFPIISVVKFAKLRALLEN